MQTHIWWNVCTCKCKHTYDVLLLGTLKWHLYPQLHGFDSEISSKLNLVSFSFCKDGIVFSAKVKSPIHNVGQGLSCLCIARKKAHVAHNYITIFTHKQRAKLGWSQLKRW